LQKPCSGGAGFIVISNELPMTEVRRPFPCTGCGACCRRVGLVAETRYLDRGDGACRHYDDSRKSCGIYEHRPLVCRVEPYFDAHFAQRYDWDEFVALNLAVCAQLAAQDDVPPNRT